MDWTDQKPFVEAVLEWTAACALGAASGFAGFAILPSSPFAGAPVAGGAAAALAMTLIGLAAMRSVGGTEIKPFDFELQPFEQAGRSEEPLELVDRIEAPAEDSRVVRLFAPETIAAPGELAARIDDWLIGARDRLGADGGERVAPEGHGPRSSPASAALHAALSDIRRSLR